MSVYGDDNLIEYINVCKADCTYIFNVDADQFKYIKHAVDSLVRSRENNRKYYKQRREKIGDVVLSSSRNSKKIYKLNLEE